MTQSYSFKDFHIGSCVKDARVAVLKNNRDNESLSMEKDCGDLGILFQETIGDIKASFSLYDEFANKAVKLNSAIKLTIAASVAFHEAFFKLADTANGTRGASKDIGAVLTRLCLRHQAVEVKLKAYAMSLIDLLVIPIQKSLDDWQKAVAQLDKDRNRGNYSEALPAQAQVKIKGFKELENELDKSRIRERSSDGRLFQADYKKAYGELKKASAETVRLQKKLNKGKTDVRGQMDEASRDAGAKYAILEETEKRSVVSALLEERSHLCLLVSCLKPVLDHEISMLNEVNHLQEITDNLTVLSGSGSVLPPAAEQLISDAAQGQLSPHITDNKRKPSTKEDIRIEVVSGTLKCTGDAYLNQLSDVPSPSCSPNVSPQVQAALSPSEAFVKRSKSIQASCHSNPRMQHLDTGTATDRRMPYESCQSLQCSSGYGTMTNISASSVEMVEYPGVYEMLPDDLPPCDIPRLNKYCTLPNKRPFTGPQRTSPYKPSSTVLQDMFVMPEAPDSCQLVHPPPLSILQKSGAVDSDEDFPLPPPPEDLLYPMEGQSQGQSCRESPYQRGSSNTLPAQTNVMQHLNSALLAPRRSSKQDSDPNRASNWSDKSSGYSASGDADDEDDYSFARQLKGVHLKRAESRDRSAPRLPKL